MAARSPLTGCIGPHCDATCEDVFSIEHDTTSVTTAQLSGATVTLCFDGACASTTLGSPPSGSTAFAGPSLMATMSVSTDATGTTRITLEPASDGNGNALEHKDGDSYSASIVDATGTTVFSAQGAVPYNTFTICGKTCRQAFVMP